MLAGSNSTIFQRPMCWNLLSRFNPKSFQRRAICRNLGSFSEGVKWSITLSLSLLSRVARTAHRPKMPVNWICWRSYSEAVA